MEISKKMVFVLLVLVIMISVLSTIVVLTTVSGNREIRISEGEELSEKISQETGVETAIAPPKEKTESGGSVSLTIIEKPEEE